MRSSSFLGSCFTLFVASQISAATIELQLITQPGFPLGGERRWVEALSRAGIDGVRINSGRGGEEGGIKNVGTERSPRYQVFGILTSKNQLRLPGGTFSLSNIGGIRSWAEKLKADGTDGLFTPKGAFGLTGKQLLAVHEGLSTQIPFSTKGEKSNEVIARIIRLIPIGIKVHASAKEGLASDEIVLDELAGVSTGTALAASLRPLGLVLVPHRPQGGSVTLWISDARVAKEVWPVGWPPEKSPADTFPKLYEFLTVEIGQDYKLTDALDAIQQKIAAPLLYDHNNMARYGVELSEVRVSLPEQRTYYKKVFDRLLGQSKPRLTNEIRVDESGQPFLWITTLKP